MNPFKFGQLMKHLTRVKQEKPDLPDVFRAIDAPIPPKKESIETMEAINRFVRDNPRQDMAGGGRIKLDAGGDAVRLAQLKSDYDKFGKSKLDKGAKVLGFKNYAAMEGQPNANFRRKIKEQLTKYGEVLPKGFESDRRGRRTRIATEQGIQIKLLEETNKKKFFDPKQFAKDNNISLTKLKQQANRLQRNIYKKRMLEAGKDIGGTLEWIPKDPRFSDNALNKLWKSKLIKYERDKIDELFYDAFGREFKKGTRERNPSYNRRKFLAIKKNLNEYRQLRNAINKKYPNINFELDHPLSKSSLNKLFNATAEQLTRVNPLEADLNNGFKDTLSLQYEKAVEGNNLNKKKAVEKIARDLKLNIGKISDDATNFKYGVQEFQKLNIKNEIGKSLENLQFLNKNFRDYAKKNPELFKTAGIRTQQTFTQISPSEVRGVRNIIASLGGGNCGRGFKNQGGRVGLQDGTTSVDVCYDRAVKRINSGFKNATPAEAKNYTKLLNTIKSSAAIGKNILKFGIVPEALYVGADSLFRVGLGDTFKEAGLRAGDFFIPGDQTRDADVLKAQRTLGGSAATNVGKILDYRNQIAKIDSLESQKQNLENLSDVGEFDYIGDLSQDVKNIDTRLNQAKNNLQNKFMVSEAETVAGEKALEESFDISKAKSPFARLQLFARNIEGVQDDPFLSDVTSPEKTQMDLNLNMLPTLPTDIMQFKTSDAIDLAQALRAGGQDVSAKDVLAYRDQLKQMPLIDASNQFGREQVFGTQGTFFGQPLAGGGIAKLAGVDSGPPPASGPNSQGLQGLMKRVKKL
jgi:hypothetical protein